MKKREAAGILLLLGVAGLFLWWFCGLIRGPSYPVFAHVDKVEPEIPGLIIEATRGFGGELFITNKTGKDVVIFDQGGRSLSESHLIIRFSRKMRMTNGFAIQIVT